MFHEIPPDSEMSLTRLEIIRPARQPGAQSYHMYHPMRALGIAGAAADRGRSQPPHRGPGPGRGILRIHSDNAQRNSLSSPPSPKSPRFAHLATIHNEMSPQDETQSVTRTIRPPGGSPKPKDSGQARTVPRNRAKERASAGLNQLLRDGPTADSYVGVDGSQSEAMFDTTEAPPSGSGSDEDHTSSSASLFTKMGYRPPTPPLETSSPEPSEPVEQEERDIELDTTRPEEPAQPGETQPASPASEPQVPGPSTVADMADPGEDELPPPPYSSVKPDKPLGEDEAADPISEDTTPATASARPSTTLSTVASSTATKPAQMPSQSAIVPPLRIDIMGCKGQGVVASRPILFGEILVRENPLIDERHDTIAGGTRRIRES